MAGRSGSARPWSNPSRRGAMRPPARTMAKELIGATLAFALLCGLAAALRNVIQRRLAQDGSAGEVISLVPAKAGTESSKTLDSRLRGNDRRYVPRAAMYSASAAAFDTLRLLIAPGSASRANRSQVARVS